MAQDNNGESSKKTNNSSKRTGRSSTHKPTSASRQNLSRESSAEKQQKNNSFNLQSAIASKVKALGIKFGASQDKSKNVKTNPKPFTQKNSTQKKQIQTAARSSETHTDKRNHASEKQPIKLGNILDTSKMKPPIPQVSSIQSTRSGSSAHRTRSKFPQGKQKAKGAANSGELTFSAFIGEYTKRTWVRVLLVTFVALFMIYIIYQIYLNYYTDIKTEIASISTYSETIDTEGIAIRDEYIIDETLSDSAVSAVENGAKVSKDQTIINIFDSAQAAAAYKRIAEIDEEISELQSMATVSDDSANEVTNIEKQLDEQVTNLTKYVNNGSLNKISEIKSDITYLMNKRLVAMRKVEDYQDRIDSLNQEKESLEATYSEEPSTISAPYSGYYVNSLDGYENLLNTSMLSELTVSDLDDIMDQEVTVPENSAGKLIEDFSWYIACPVSAKEAEDYLSVNSVYTLILPYSETGSLQGTLVYINNDDGDQYLAIFRCTSLMSELCTIRRQPVKIQIRSYTGFNIKKSALHINVTTVETTDEDGNVTEEEVRYPCVYTIVGNQVVVKKVNILYNGDKVVICSSNENGSGYLALYDKVITEGKSLYAGKIIN